MLRRLNRYPSRATDMEEIPIITEMQAMMIWPAVPTKLRAGLFPGGLFWLKLLWQKKSKQPAPAVEEA